VTLGRLLAVLVLLVIPARVPPLRASVAGPGFSIAIENPSVRIGEKAMIVATLTARPGYRITDSYRHRIVSLAATDAGLVLAGEVARGSVEDGRIVFRVEVVPKKAGVHGVTGVFRFSVHDGRQLDIRAAPFEATVTATE
jgi:hypothetical protein